MNERPEKDGQPNVQTGDWVRVKTIVYIVEKPGYWSGSMLDEIDEVRGSDGYVFKR